MLCMYAHLEYFWMTFDEAEGKKFSVHKISVVITKIFMNTTNLYWTLVRLALVWFFKKKPVFTKLSREAITDRLSSRELSPKCLVRSHLFVYLGIAENVPALMFPPLKQRFDEMPTFIFTEGTTKAAFIYIQFSEILDRASSIVYKREGGLLKYDPSFRLMIGNWNFILSQ